MDNIPEILPRYDAVIVGARCAGASTALLLARAGARVLVIDRQAYGTDVTSTHALMRTGVLQLQRWGLLPRIMAADTPAIRNTTFHYGEEAVRLDIKPEHGVEHLCAPRRTVLDRILVDAAREAGADVRHGVLLADLQTRADGRVVGAWLKDANGNRTFVRAGIVIGADGRQSTVARLMGAETFVEGTGATGCVYGYFADLPDDGVHWYFGENVAAGVIPTNHGQHCVFVGVPRARFAATFRRNLDRGFQQVAAANASDLSGRLDKARLVGSLRGFAGTPGYLKQCYGPGWALVGDAAYFKDPLTAHGITDALRDAELLARAVLDGRTTAMAEYQQARDTLSRPLFDVTDSIASFDWTLDDVKALHGTLSASMRAEGHHVAQLTTATMLAA